MDGPSRAIRIYAKFMTPAYRERREWVKPFSLVGVGTDGNIVECVSYETPSGLVHVRMIPGQPTSAVTVPVSGLCRINLKRFKAEVASIQQAIDDVASLRTDWEG